MLAARLMLGIADLDGRSVVLVGLMGAGKSSIGRRLAGRLGLPFADADDEIEKAAGYTVADYFQRHGEAAFRDGEKRVIARLLEHGPRVLATGGGAFMDPDTRACIAKRGVSIWLSANLDILVRRTARRGARPLLDTGDPEAALKALMEKRNPVYAEADIQVDSGGKSLDLTVEATLDALATWCRETKNK